MGHAWPGGTSVVEHGWDQELVQPVRAVPDVDLVCRSIPVCCLAMAWFAGALEHVTLSGSSLTAAYSAMQQTAPANRYISQ